MNDSAPAAIKCLVWDLDNTLWKGTLLEGDDVRLIDGLRDVIVELDGRGILQSIASRNSHDLAWARLEDMGIAEYFVLPEIGFGPKSEAVRRIADRLQFAHKTMAFIDDQPAERAEVAFHLPEVRCYPADQAGALPELLEFTPSRVTTDSRRRRQMYQANFRREAEQTAFIGSDREFLRSLDLVLRLSPATPAELARVEELTLRASQMNATGVHYPEAELRDLMADPGHEVLVATLTDRFGPHGAIGVILLEKHQPVWHLKLLATSCRVVPFGVGAAIIGWLADRASAAGAHLVAAFRRTERNRMMEVAYRFGGFTDDACACLAALAAPGVPEIQRLHLMAEPQDPPSTMRLIGPGSTE